MQQTSRAASSRGGGYSKKRADFYIVFGARYAAEAI